MKRLSNARDLNKNVEITKMLSLQKAKPGCCKKQKTKKNSPPKNNKIFMRGEDAPPLTSPGP